MTRDELRRAGEHMRERLGQAPSAPGTLGSDAAAPGFAQMMSEAAMDNGFSREQVIEAVIQTAPYAGFPFALNALGALSDAMQRPR